MGDSKTCMNSKASPRSFNSDYFWKRDAAKLINTGALKWPGIADHSNAANPVKEWTHIYVPYCTGDLHWGDKDVLQEPHFWSCIVVVSMPPES